MIDLTFNTTTGIAELVEPVTFKAAGDVSVRITFSSNPGALAAGSIRLSIGTNEIAPETLAYTEAFTGSTTVYTAVLDASDTRLADFMEDRGPEPVAVDLLIELIITLGGNDIYAPSLPCTVEPPVVTGPVSPSTGPFFVRVNASDVLVDPTAAELIAANPSLGGGGVSQIYIMTAAGVVTSYATLPLADAAAASVDAIFVGPGTYNVSNLGKVATKVVHTFDPNAVIDYTGAARGVLEDSTTGLNADLNVEIHGAGRLLGNGPDGVIHIERAGSRAVVNADEIGDEDSAIAYFVERGEFFSHTRVLTSQAVTSYWFGGDGYVTHDKIVQTGAELGINAAVAAMPNVETNSIWYLTSQLTEGAQTAIWWYSTDASNRFWDSTLHIKGGSQGGIVFDSATNAGIIYVTCQKTECDAGTSSYACLHLVGNGGTLHWTGQKLEGGRAEEGFGLIVVVDGEHYIWVLDDMKDTGLTGAACVNVYGGEIELSIRRLVRTTNGHGIEVNGGTLRLSNSRIDVSAFSGKSGLRGTSGATRVSLQNVHLQVHSGADSISSIDGSTFTVICLGGVTSNKDVGANVTVIGSLIVDPNFA